jgi:hypothetical protein
MGTRGLIAVVDGTFWRGFYRHLDCYPEGAGVELVALLGKHGLERCAQRIVSATLMENCGERATPATHGNQGDLEWFYLLDVAGRTLTVYCQGPRATPGGPSGFESWSRWVEAARLAVAPDGRCTPPTLQVSVPAPWPQLAVTPAWPDDDRAAVLRLDVRKRVTRDALAAGFTEVGFHALLEFAVTEAILQAPWPREVGAELFVMMPWTTNSTYLRLQLGQFTLHYPADSWSRRTEPALSLFSPTAGEVEVSVERADLLVRLPERQRVEGIFISALPSEGWLFAIFDLLRARTVPDLRGEEVVRLALPPQQADDWRVFLHPDGRVWSIRPAHGGFQLRLGAPDDDPVFKERKGSNDERDRLIAEQLADGFVERPK